MEQPGTVSFLNNYMVLLCKKLSVIACCVLVPSKTLHKGIVINLSDSPVFKQQSFKKFFPRDFLVLFYPMAVWLRAAFGKMHSASFDRKRGHILSGQMEH